MDMELARILIRHDARNPEEWVGALIKLAELSDEAIEQIFHQYKQSTKSATFDRA